MKKWLFVMVMMLAGTVIPEGLPYEQWLYDCDSMMLIRKFNEGIDTIKILRDTNHIDTFLADTTFDSTGLYILELVVWPEDEDYSLSGWDMVYNTYGVGYVLSAPVSTPTDSFLCRMYGYVRTNDQVAVEGAQVSATFGRQGLVDTCNHVVITPKATTTTTDSVGYFYLDITKSKCIKASDQKVTISISYPGGSTTSSAKYTVPDSASCWFIGKD